MIGGVDRHPTDYIVLRIARFGGASRHPTFIVLRYFFFSGLSLGTLV